MAAASESPDDDSSRPEDAAQAASPGATEGDTPATDAPDPKEAAAPDDVIREPEDVAPDSSEGEEGEARRVDVTGEMRPMDAPDTELKRAALIYNPIKVNQEKLRDRVAALSAEAGWAEPLFFETTVDDLGDDATRAALDEKVDAVLVAGGDGTVRAVSEAVTSTGVPLTIVPSGTGNLLARNLNLPLTDADAMIQATFTGKVHPTDIGIARIRRTDGTVDEHAFVVMAGMGLDAAMIANTRPELKKAMGWIAYVDGAARSLATMKPFRVMYQLETGRLHSTKVQSILFANCGALPAGLSLIPQASIADGKLDVVVIQPSGMFGWLAVWRRVWWHNSVVRRFRRTNSELSTRDRSVLYLRGTDIETATAPAQPIELDGDEFGEATRIFCRVVAGGLTLMVPEGHDTSEL